MDLLSMLLNDMHLRGATMLRLSLGHDARVQIATGTRAVFHVVASGAVRVGCAAADAGELALQAGDVLIFPAGTQHELGGGEAGTTVEFSGQMTDSLHVGTQPATAQLVSGQAQFDPELARPFMAALPPVMLIAAQGGQMPPWVGIGLQFILEELRANLPAQQAIVNRMADILLIECIRRYVAELPEGSRSWLRALLDPALSRALAALHANPARHWSVNSLAAEANLSRSAFAQRFVACMGQGPMAYLRGHRLRLAAWHLRHSSQPVSAIAEAAGYGSTSAFTQAFGRDYGCSPRGYRDSISTDSH